MASTNADRCQGSSFGDQASTRRSDPASPAIASCATNAAVSSRRWAAAFAMSASGSPASVSSASMRRSSAGTHVASSCARRSGWPRSSIDAVQIFVAGMSSMLPR